MAMVGIFNACSEEVILVINGGPPLHVPPTGDTSNWIAQQPQDPVGWSERTTTPGSFRYGQNTVAMYRAGQDPAAAQAPDIQIAETGGEVTSLQMYLFWHSGEHLSWVFLREGKPTQFSQTMLSTLISF